MGAGGGGRARGRRALIGREPGRLAGRCKQRHVGAGRRPRAGEREVAAGGARLLLSCGKVGTRWVRRGGSTARGGVRDRELRLRDRLGRVAPFQPCPGGGGPSSAWGRCSAGCVCVGGVFTPGFTPRAESRWPRREAGGGRDSGSGGVHRAGALPGRRARAAASSPGRRGWGMRWAAAAPELFLLPSPKINGGGKKRNPSKNRFFEQFIHHTTHLLLISGRREEAEKVRSVVSSVHVCHCSLILLAALGDQPELLRVWIFSGVSALG